MLLRGVADGETVALALLGAHRRAAGAGWFASRSLYLNETGDPQFDSPMIEHNGILAAAGLRNGCLRRGCSRGSPACAARPTSFTSAAR